MIGEWGSADWRRFIAIAARATATPLPFFLDLRVSDLLSWIETAVTMERPSNG